MKLSDYYQNASGRNDTASYRQSVNRTGEDGLDWMVNCVARVPAKGGRLLDIGCQAGDLVDRVQADFDSCYGVDIGDYSESWQQIAGAEFMVHDIDSAQLPLPDGHFDVVTCFMVLEHVFDVFGLLGEISRLTRPGGHSIIEVPNAGYIKHVIALLRGRVPRTGDQIFPFEETQGWDCQHLHYFTLPELVQLCEQFGLKTIEHGSRGGYKKIRRICPSLLYSSVTLMLKKQP